MKQNIQVCKALGCAGIVSGVLHKDNTLDIERTKELIELSKPMSFTFHRAFDCVPDPIKTLEKLIALGVDRVLTSGQKTKAENGIQLLKQLKLLGEHRIIILPGSGINVNNAKRFKEAGFKELHTSASKNVKNQSTPCMFDVTQKESRVETIKSILKIIQGPV